MITSINMVSATFIPASTTILYTTPSGTTTRIIQCSLTNTSASNVTVNLYVASASSAPTSSEIIVKSKTIRPNETWTPVSLINMVLGAGNTLQADASVATSIVIKASGIEITN